MAEGLEWEPNQMFRNDHSSDSIGRVGIAIDVRRHYLYSLLRDALWSVRDRKSQAHVPILRDPPMIPLCDGLNGGGEWIRTIGAGF